MFIMASSESKDDGKVAVGVQTAPPIGDTVLEYEYTEIDESYLSLSWFPKLYRGVLFQMILFGA